MSKRIADIEILRGFAVILVVLHHAHGNLITWSIPVFEKISIYMSGWFGVDLFFAISGFVIARDLLPKLQACSDREGFFRVTLAFWVRRAWRLLPSAWLWLIFMLLAVRFFNDSGAFGSWRANIEAAAAGVLQLANIRFAETFGVREYGVSFAYWSLSLEEQFYLFLPLAVLFFKKWLPVFLGVLIAFQMFAERDLMMLVFRSDALMLGVLLAILARKSAYAMVRPSFLQRLPGKGVIPLLVIVLLMGIVGSDVLSVVSYKYSVIAILSLILVWIASYDENWFSAGIPFRRVMLWIGSRSYGIYLIHVPAFFLAREIWFRMRPGVPLGNDVLWPLVVTAAVILLALSDLNFRLVERRLRKYGASVADRIVQGGVCEGGRMTPISLQASKVP